MGDTALDTILVVSEREFPVNRAMLTENSSYFRAMFEGGFKESSADRIELKSVGDADAFAMLLDCIQNKRVNLKELLGILPSVLELCDALSLNEVFLLLKQELFKNWSELETVESISAFAEAMNLRPQLWSHILHFLRNEFQKIGSRDSEECDVSIIDESPDLIADILGTEEESTLCFWDMESDESFVRGVSSWALIHQLPQSSIRKIVRCFGALYRDKDELMKVIDTEEITRGSYTLKPEVHNFIRDTDAYFRSSTYRLCVGSFGPNNINMFLLNFRDGKWDFLKFDNLFVKCFGERSWFTLQSCVGEATTRSMKVDTSYWYMQPNPLGYCYFGTTDDAVAKLPSRRLPMYTSAQLVSSGMYYLLVFELEYGAKMFSKIFRTEVPGPILRCELVRLEGVLHGFMTYEVESLYNVCHFVLHKNNDARTWYNTNFQLEPLLSDIRLKYIPEATTVSTEGNIVVFLRCLLKVFLAEYNIRSGFLKPLGHEELPFFVLGTTCKEGKYVRKHKKVCTIDIACCSDDRHPIYNLYSAPGKERLIFMSRFLHNFENCSKNDNHVPELKSKIHICETL